MSFLRLSAVAKSLFRMSNLKAKYINPSVSKTAAGFNVLCPLVNLHSTYNFSVGKAFEGWENAFKPILLTFKVYQAYTALFKTPQNPSPKDPVLKLNLNYNKESTVVEMRIQNNEESPYSQLKKKAFKMVKDPEKYSINLYIKNNDKTYTFFDDDTLITVLKSIRINIDGSNPTVEVKAIPKLEDNLQLASEVRGYDYITTRSYTAKLTEDQLNTYIDEMNDFIIGEHQSHAEAWGGDGIDGATLLDTLKCIADEYKWSEKIKSAIKGITNMEKQCSADMKITFKDHTMTSNYVRFYSWRNVNTGGQNATYSVRVVTSGFVYNVPKDQIEGSNWLTKGKSIKSKNLQQIEAVMENRAVIAAETQIPPPKQIP